MSHKEKVEALIMKAIENNLAKDRREQALDLRAVYDALKFGDFTHLNHIGRR